MEEDTIPKKDYHAPMHTAEHVLNQTMDRMYGCGRAFSSHVERKKSKCDYHFHRALMSDEEVRIEQKVNEILSGNFPIYDAFESREEAERNYNLKRLPEDAGEMIRIVHIGDYDACPCIGEHVANTAEVGIFKIISTDFLGDRLRIRYKLI